MSGVDWLEEAFPHRVFINPIDATSRGLSNGDEVRVFNDRGELRIKCRVTRRIMPGVIAIPQGAWQKLDAKGVDIGGSANTLTAYKPSPLAKSNPQHTNLVQVEKA